MKITVNALTFNRALEKADEMGYRTVCICGLHFDIEELLKEDSDNETKWIIVGDVMFNATDIGKANAEIYTLDY